MIFKKYKNLNILISIYKILPRHWKIKIGTLLCLMVLGAFFEFITIGSVAPFIAVLIDPEATISFLERFVNIKFHELGYVKTTIFLTAIFVLFVIVSTVVRWLVLRLSIKFSYDCSAYFGSLIFNNIIHKDFTYLNSTNSGTLVALISRKSGQLATDAIFPALTIVNSLVVIFPIVIYVVYLSPIISFFITAVFLSFYVLYFIFLSKIFEKNSQIISNSSSSLFKIINESLGSLRSIILDDKRDFFYNQFITTNNTLQNTLGKNSFFSQIPRVTLEVLGIIILVFTSLILVFVSDNKLNVISSIGVIVFASQRLIPLVQNAYRSWSTIMGEYHSLAEAVDLAMFEKKVPINGGALDFQHSINFKNVSFTYDDGQDLTISELNFRIKKGEKIALIGASGSGKSTLLDLIAGLISPSSGSISIDDTELSNANIDHWQRNVSYAPQHVYILDGTLEENIAFGVGKGDFDRQKFIECINVCGLDELTELRSKKSIFNLGDNGAQLSGGQRQRVGIARALYKAAPLLILDEATGNLDVSSEREVLKNIFNVYPDCTCIFISHRKENLDIFERTHVLEYGKIKSF